MSRFHIWSRKPKLEFVEHRRKAGLLEPETEASAMAKDLRGHADVLEELANGILRL